MSERLNEVKRLLNKYYDSEDGFEQTDLAIAIIQGHVGELIKQVEQVKGMQEIIDILQISNDERYEQNKRYREAIEQVKDNIPLEFNHKSEIDAKKNAIRLINISHVVDKALEDKQ